MQVYVAFDGLYKNCYLKCFEQTMNNIYFSNNNKDKSNT